MKRIRVDFKQAVRREADYTCCTSKPRAQTSVVINTRVAPLLYHKA